MEKQKALKSLPLYLIIGAVVVLGALWWSRSPEEALVHIEQEDEKELVVQLSDEELNQAHIKIERIEPRVIEESFTAPGKVLLNQYAEAYVVPRVKGIVVEILKGSGKPVEQGEILAWIDSVEVAEAKARYLKALKEEELAKAVFDSQQLLHEKQIIAEQEYWESARDLDEAVVDTVVASQYLRALGLGKEEIEEISKDSDKPFSLYPLKAPIGGSIIKGSLTIGELVDSDKQAFLISDLDQLHVELSVSPKDIQKVRIGQECVISTLKGDVETLGKITSITPSIDNKTRLGRAVCLIPNTDRGWMPGTFVNGRVITAKHDVAFAVHKEAIKNYEGAQVLFIKGEDGFTAKEVCVGRCDGHYVEIVENVEGGEEYVAENAFILKAQFSNNEGE